MNYGSSQVANKATLNLILGVFLKLLGFFVVMYTYTDTNPIKARQAEESLRERFNISVSLLRDESKGDNESMSGQVLQQEGRAFIAIRDELKTQLDFLSSRYLAASNALVMTVPAEYVVSLNDEPAQSPRFASILTKTLLNQESAKASYALEIVIHGSDEQELAKAISVFVQKMIAADYPPQLLTIGVEQSEDAPIVEFRVTHVPKAGAL